MKFTELDIKPEILKALKEEGYTEPTAIQEQSIPLVLDRKDVLGCAQTGTGKTAAFAIPTLQLLSEEKRNLNGKRKILSLVLTPTRELAIQIGESFDTYGKYLNIKSTVIFGGVSQNAQTKILDRGVDVLIATPGRLLDLMGQGYISLNDVKYFILDEADRMLDMGFINDIKKVLTKLPKKKQTLFFSATMPTKIVRLADDILNNPKQVTVNPVSSTAETIQQYLYTTNRTSKTDLLLHILKDQDLDQVLVFSRTKHGADRIVKKLIQNNITSAAIHGNKSQNQRQKALQAFKDGSVRVLVASDIAARGIDIDKLKYVINFDIPNEPETYVHRIGRCGRAGEEGIAISIGEPEEIAYLKDIEKLINQKFNIIKDHPYPQTDKPMTTAEKKAFEKEKNRKKQEFFANRKKNKNNKNGSNRNRR